MNRTILRLTLLLGAGLLAACSGNNDNNDVGSLEVIHASQDAPGVNVLVDGVDEISNLPYKGVETVNAAKGDRTVEVQGIVPGGNVTVIPAAGDPAPVIAVTKGSRTTIVAAGDVATIAPLVLSEPSQTVDAAEVRLRVLHAASSVGQVNVYITEPADPLGPPTGTFSFGDLLTPDALVVPAGDYRVRVTPSTAPATVVYDSGTITLPGGADLVVAAVVNTGAGVAPISLLASTGSAGLEFLDVGTPSNVRAIHASPDAPDVDIIADDDFANPAAEDLAYGTATPTYLTPAPGPINLKVVPANAITPVVIDADLTLTQGESYSVYAAGLLGGNSIQALTLVDDIRRVATEARLRLVHASPAAGNVDIYVVAAGDGADLDNQDPAFTDVPFLADTGYVSLAPDDYDVVVTAAGSKLPAIGPITLTLNGNGIYTAAARDEAGGGVPLGLILLDDLAP